MDQFDEIQFVIETTLPGRFAAKVVAYHRGVCTYEKVISEDASLRAATDAIAAECIVVRTQVGRGKLEPVAKQLPPTTPVV